MAKVKEDVAKNLAEKRAHRDSRFAQLAKEKGISLEELRAQMAKKHQEKLEKMAKNLGISVEELKQILPPHPMKK